MTIRNGKKDDLPRVLELVKELALFEKAPHEVTNTLERMEYDGFGPDPIYGFFVAENSKGIIGLSLYYWRYSTWKGRRLYLEDIIVTELARGQRIGQKLFLECVRYAVEKNYSGMLWQVLDWNKDAIRFYDRFGAKYSGEWLNGSLEAAELAAIARG